MKTFSGKEEMSYILCTMSIVYVCLLKFITCYILCYCIFNLSVHFNEIDLKWKSKQLARKRLARVAENGLRS